ncbi:MAG: ATP-binding protein [Bacteroidales bacterium]|nr:ATP-binding protein [Bacteroidales bacterium]
MKRHYIHKLIEQGEHLKLDFKFAINDSRKIARAMVAFANAKGGRLLIGVKDNGKIAGVRTEEEFHMVEAAAQMYCKPEIVFRRKDWMVESRKVLEIVIPESKEKPVFAQKDKGKWLAYVRVDDENVLANVVMLNVWKKQKSTKGVKINYSKAEKFLLSYVNQNKNISLNQFYKQAGISRYRAINILSDLIVVGIIDYDFQGNRILYKLKNEKKQP